MELREEGSENKDSSDQVEAKEKDSKGKKASFEKCDYERKNTHHHHKKTTTAILEQAEANPNLESLRAKEVMWKMA